MKTLARTSVQFIIGGIFGFLAVSMMFWGFSFDLAEYTNVIVISLYVLIGICLLLTMILFQQMKTLNAKNVEGEEEDEIDIIKYRKVADQSLLIYLSFTLAILSSAIVLIMSLPLAYIIISIILIIISSSFMTYMIDLVRKSYPERNMPKLSDPDYGKKLLEAADDGEKHVMLMGFYKAYNLLPTLLIIAITLSVIYSILTGQNQLFSIVGMSVVLLIVQGSYVLTIRKK
ncbi:DUF3169 family protein [Bacillus sp. JCM 19034]|uniref:DUF3169 family protein n=1 Tax=Bacillus sp. JCM 19034 TaxID=1481928 RepID=UPI000781E342|nr:DUF3169 family protein [Bacillus sp. JCM 19034]